VYAVGHFFRPPAHPRVLLRILADVDLSGSHRTMIESGSANFGSQEIYNVETF